MTQVTKKAGTEVSIQKALTILKGLSKKVNNGMTNCKSAVLLPPNGLIDGLYSKEAFITKEQSNMKAVDDFIAQRKIIKAAIYQSNSSTEVTIAGSTMTVAEAIARREVMADMFTYYANLRTQISLAKRAITMQESKNTELAEKLALQALGKDTKLQGEEAQAFIKTYIERNTSKLVLSISEEDLTQKEKELNEFAEEVDVVLSESNAVTKITI